MRPNLPTIVILWVFLGLACWVGMFTVSFRWAWDGCPSGITFGPDPACADPRLAVITGVTMAVFFAGTGALVAWYRRGRRADAEDATATT